MLNERQKEAVSTLNGPVLILAGAGAGKTRVIVERIRELIHSGVAPSSILAITFTNKAAREMRERVEIRLKEDKALNRPISSDERPFVSTFHALGVHILKEQSLKIGLKRHFTIFDRDDSKKAVKEALLKLDLDPKTHDPMRILSIISKEKGRGVHASEYVPSQSNFSQTLKAVWSEYENILKRDNALDFDDLLLKTLDTLKENKEIRKYYQSKWSHVSVDEYQDTNRIQYEIAKSLVGEEKNICVVGDIDQSIYSWRGADIANILDFEKDFPNAKVVLLEENYRSTKNILNAANAVIEKNKIRRKKNLFTANSAGEQISISESFDEAGEAEFIATKACELIKKGLLPSDIAVLYRANFQSRVLEEAFLHKNIPYQIIGTRFFERKEVKDIISYLRAALDQSSLSDVKRIINSPTRGLGKSTVAKIFLNQEETLPPATRFKINNFRKLLSEINTVVQEKKPSEIIAHIIQVSGLEKEWKEEKEGGAERLLNAYELVNFASKYDLLSGLEGVENFLTDSALSSDQDELDGEKRGVRLMTVHASKGLEFDAVFVAGLEDGLFPLEKSEKEMTPEEAEEERRLFYVAITRARKKVFLSYTQVRTVFGRKGVNIPSEFIFDIPEELTEREAFEGQGVGRKPLLEIEF